MTDDMIFRLVAPGDARRVVDTYCRAVAHAQRVRAALVSAGLDADMVLIVPSLTEACEPVVYLTTVTGTAETRLAHILGGGAGPPPDDPGGDHRAA
ncbi:MAG: hypothetical protein GEU83_15625 [Pseudonocardiaceae bacterium]|nr:hypothetical protein [Pseudonocardiaceae bacterium]